MNAPIQAPVTGKECLVSSHSALYALVGFYSAFNTRDLGAMSRNWAQTDEAVMANPPRRIAPGLDFNPRGLRTDFSRTCDSLRRIP